MPISGPDVLLYEKKDKIVTITINRPERMNALSLELWQKLAEAWERFRKDDDAWVAILTASGDKAFCAGFDLLEAAKGLPEIEMPEIGHIDIWKPMISAINGFAVAGGFMIAMSCDIRIASEHAQFGISETKWNLPAYWVSDLSKWMSLGHALEIALWGDDRIGAQRAYEMGLINRIVPKEKLMEEAMTWAERMIYLAPRCVRNVKEIIYRGYYMPWQDGRSFGTALEQNLKGMQDTLEGSTAFAEKRKPKFQNR